MRREGGERKERKRMGVECENRVIVEPTHTNIPGVDSFTRVMFMRGIS